jgi:hypothetical protein
MTSFFQCTFHKAIFYTRWCNSLCAAVLLFLCNRFGWLYFLLKFFYMFLCIALLIRYVSHILSVCVQQYYFVLFCQAGHRTDTFSILCTLPSVRQWKYTGIVLGQKLKGTHRRNDNLE